MRPRRLLLLALAALAVLLSACGERQPVRDATTEGDYVNAGGLAYQVQYSRELNPQSVEDAAYLQGLPPGTKAPSGSQEWFGVFIRVENQGHGTVRSLSDFEITDTQGNTYRPVALPASNVFSYQPTVLSGGGTIPVPDSQQQTAPTQGAELLFKISTSAYQNRPLTLRLLGPGTGGATQELGAVSLDL